jgi:hypothetical protein
MSTGDIVFTCAAVLSVLLLCAGVFIMGFGEATMCTDVRGNGDVAPAPCKSALHGMWLNTVLQGVVLVIAWLAGGRERSRQWMAWSLLAVSVGAFVISWQIARTR